MAVGYGCKMDNENRSIRQSKKYQPITPDWCPVKNGTAPTKKAGFSASLGTFVVVLSFVILI